MSESKQKYKNIGYNLKDFFFKYDSRLKNGLFYLFILITCLISAISIFFYAFNDALTINQSFINIILVFATLSFTLFGFTLVAWTYNPKNVNNANKYISELSFYGKMFLIIGTSYIISIFFYIGIYQSNVISLFSKHDTANLIWTMILKYTVLFSILFSNMFLVMIVFDFIKMFSNINYHQCRSTVRYKRKKHR